jgi:hypothetical protein
VPAQGWPVYWSAGGVDWMSSWWIRSVASVGVPLVKPQLIPMLAATGLMASACSPFAGQATRPKASPAVPSRSPIPSPSPTPDPFGPPLPSPQGGPLPGQGLPVSGSLAVPLLVQIENTAPSRPQAGLAAASVIFQSLAEGNITRLSVLFHRVPGVIGPIRSARFVTSYLAQRFGAVVMCSGGSPPTLSRLVAAQVPTLVNDYDHGAHFFRWSGRAAPHNVYSSQAQAVAASGATGVLRSDDFARGDGWAGTEPSPVVDVPAYRTTFTYGDGSYQVVTEGAVLTDVIFGNVRPVSVAVLHVPQAPVPSVVDVLGNPVRDFNLAASGPAELYAGGTLIHGSWSAPGPTGTITFADATSRPVAMPRGLLWAALAP